MKVQKVNLNLGPADMHGLSGFLRLGLIVLMVGGFGAFCSLNFHDVDPREVAQWWIEKVPLVFSWWPDAILLLFSAVANKYSLRYMLVPATAILSVFIAGGYYVKDVYALPTFNHALHYVNTAMLGTSYPRLAIDKGEKRIKKNEVNLLDRIGGPGYLSIEPGSAAIVRELREPPKALLTTTYFLAPFETIVYTVDLDEQQCDRDQIEAQTRDGIKVLLCDVHFRYRIQQQVRDGSPARRSIEDPYPFDPDALNKMLSNLSVEKDGQLDRWNTAVERAVTGAITDFIASSLIDSLTAPRNENDNPHLKMRNELLYSGVKRGLENLGAELLWVDVGHLEIIEPVVDEQRTRLWATDWVKDAAVARAYAEAKRVAYQELGRAEAQAELILSIADALSNADLSNNPRENIRKILLARTAQVLDSLSAPPKS
jgi:regulator of protease activity HflC (stomatin/prohibitin superfamily)